LEEVVRELDLDCEVIARPAEEAAKDPELRSQHVLATARALGPPEKARPLLVPLLQPGGKAAVFVGETGKLPPDFRIWRPGIAIVEVS
jgi:16S rRNA G527 N7-methylase RsmG